MDATEPEELPGAPGSVLPLGAPGRRDCSGHGAQARDPLASKTPPRSWEHPLEINFVIDGEKHHVKESWERQLDCNYRNCKYDIIEDTNVEDYTIRCGVTVVSQPSRHR